MFLRSSLTRHPSILLQFFVQGVFMHQKLLGLSSFLKVKFFSVNCVFVAEIMFFLAMNRLSIWNFCKLRIFWNNKLLRNLNLTFVSKNRINRTFRHKVILFFVSWTLNWIYFHSSITTILEYLTTILCDVHLRFYLVIRRLAWHEMSLICLSCLRRRNNVIFSLLRG